MNSPEIGLETLLDLDGSILEEEGGYWIKIEARRVHASEHPTRLNRRIGCWRTASQRWIA